MRNALIKTALLASGAALLIAAGPKADLNQDGQVTKAEFTQSAESRFYAADADNDGFLTKDERKAHKKAMREDFKNQRFAKLDTNGDGLLSKDEMDARGDSRKARKEAHRQEQLEKFDTNLDGELNDAERTVMKAERDEKRSEMKAQRSEMKAQRKDKKAKRSKRPKIDANDDGLISFDEHMAVSEQLFTRMDADGDGVLTKGEGKKRKGKRGNKRGR